MKHAFDMEKWKKDNKPLFSSYTASPRGASIGMLVVILIFVLIEIW